MGYVSISPSRCSNVLNSEPCCESAPVLCQPDGSTCFSRKSMANRNIDRIESKDNSLISISKPNQVTVCGELGLMHVDERPCFAAGSLRSGLLAGCSVSAGTPGASTASDSSACSPGDGLIPEAVLCRVRSASAEEDEALSQLSGEACSVLALVSRFYSYVPGQYDGSIDDMLHNNHLAPLALGAADADACCSLGRGASDGDTEGADASLAARAWPANACGGGRGAQGHTGSGADRWPGSCRAWQYAGAAGGTGCGAAGGQRGEVRGRGRCGSSGPAGIGPDHGLRARQAPRDGMGPDHGLRAHGGRRSGTAWALSAWQRPQQ